MVWNYLFQIGPVLVWRKIYSRLIEHQRNRKVAGIGLGRILEAPDDSGFNVGQPVIFFAPNHSPSWPRICLNVGLVAPLKARVENMDTSHQLPEPLKAYVGWSPYSGSHLHASDVKHELNRLVASCELNAAVSVKGEAEDSPAADNVCERVNGTATLGNGPTAVIFGFGNYAKIHIVPQVRKYLSLSAVHEIDPDQIVSAAAIRTVLDTCPFPRREERFDAWFIAGFHHMHASLAVKAIEDGAYAVVEKPLVTNGEQFQRLEDALSRSEGRRLFTCFHKRYSRMNEWIRADLGCAPGNPMDMHCLIYEIPLPALHWYNWPNSGSRLVSNGCHWLDYFLYMNDYCAVLEANVEPLRGRDLAAWIRLENGAQLMLSITETGSHRLGVRDVIEVRAGQVTVRMIDSMQYSAENGTRVLRRRRVNPIQAYQRMYKTICQRIIAGEPGDATHSLRSTALMLDLEEKLQARCRTAS